MRTSCKNGYFLFEYQCYEGCPSGTMADGKERKKCDSLCKECQNSVKQYATCTDGYYQLGERCYALCSLADDDKSGVHYGGDDDSMECKKCIDGDCIDCSSNYIQC